MVRLGIGLYGISFSEEEQQYLQNVSSLSSITSQIKTISARDTVGYGRKYIAGGDARIATIPIGYADGLNRKLGNGNGFMIVNGKKAPIISSVCMDMCMLDITGLEAEEGDIVYVFDDAATIKEIADRLDTCLLYTSDAADDLLSVDLGGRCLIKKKKQNNNTSPDLLNVTLTPPLFYLTLSISLLHLTHTFNTHIL